MTTQQAVDYCVNKIMAAQTRKKRAELLALTPKKIRADVKNIVTLKFGFGDRK